MRAERILRRINIQTIPDHADHKVLQILFEISPDAIPFAPESVKEYQDRIMIYKDGVSTILALAVPISLIATVIWVGVQLYGHHWRNAFLWLGGGLTTASAFFLAFCMRYISNRDEHAEYQSKPISEHTDAVPEAVLKITQAVKEKLPGAKLFICFFVAGCRGPLLVEGEGMSFLLMFYKGYYYYLNAWNEPYCRAKLPDLDFTF